MYFSGTEGALIHVLFVFFILFRFFLLFVVNFVVIAAAPAAVVVGIIANFY